MMSTHILRRLLLLCALFAGPLVGTAHAELADKDKPMNIDADALRYDEAKQTSVFTGNVSITKGTIVMRGAKMDVRQDPQGNQTGILLGSPSSLAFFRQKREALDEFIEGEAERIDYDSKTETVVLTGKASLRRLVGNVLNDENLGSEITYNSLTEVFTVKGGKGGSTEANPNGRVRAVLTPIPKDPPPAPAPDPAKLRPADKIKEKKK